MQLTTKFRIQCDFWKINFVISFDSSLLIYISLRKLQSLRVDLTSCQTSASCQSSPDLTSNIIFPRGVIGVTCWLIVIRATNFRPFK